MPSPDPGLLMLGGTTDPKKVLKMVHELTYEAFSMCHREPEEKELEKIKRILEAEMIYDQETVETTARRLGHSMMLAGTPDFEEKYLKQALQTTSNQVRMISQKIYSINNCSAAVLLPQELKGYFKKEDLEAEVKRAWEKSLKIKQFTLKKLPTPRESDLKAGKGFKKRIRRFVLENGVRLIVEENPQTPMIAYRTALLGGLRTETQHNNGISAFISEMFTRGSSHHTAEELALHTDEMAGELSGFSGRNSFGLVGDFLSKDLEESLSLLAEVLLEPTFPENEMKKQKEMQISSIRRRKDDLSLFISDLFSQALFRDHPYRLTIPGTEESVNSINRDYLLSYYQHYVRPKNFALAVAGDVAAEEVFEITKRLFGKWKGGSAKFPKLSREPSIQRPRIIEEHIHKEQAHIIYGFHGATLWSRDRFALEMCSAILSGQGGRLFSELRDKRHLAYSVSAFNIEGIEPGACGVSIATSNDTIRDALDGLFLEIEKMRSAPPSKEELDRAKIYSIGVFEIDLQTNSSRANYLSLNEIYRIGATSHLQYPSKIERLTIQDVHKASLRYYRPNGYALVIARNLGSGEKILDIPSWK